MGRNTREFFPFPLGNSIEWLALLGSSSMTGGPTTTTVIGRGGVH